MKRVNMEEQINRLQDNLHSIRKIAGWTAQDLGDKIGVTKQTISNIENKKVKLTQTQYIAIRAVLDYEINENPDNDVLAQVVPILLDSKDKDHNNEIKKAVETIAATASGGISGEQLSKVSNALLTPLLEGINGIGEVLSWLYPTKYIKKKGKKNSK